MVDGGEQPVFTRPYCERRGLGDAESGGDKHGNQENGAYHGDKQKGPPDRVVETEAPATAKRVISLRAGAIPEVRAAT